MPVQLEDLTARARIREAALELFARDGIDGVSMRSIAAKAHVSPSLVIHHFGSKARLREAVDDAVLATFETALHSVDLIGSPVEVSDRINEAIAAIIGRDQVVRSYLGRSLIEASPTSQRVFDALADLIQNGLDQLKRRRHVRPGIDTEWAAYAVLFIILGPVLLTRQLEARLGADPFADHIVTQRSATNIGILQRGLFST